MKKTEIRGSLLARNTLLNLIGKAMPLLIGVVTIPFIVQRLGAERFGLLSLAWVVLGYFAIFDLGLGRAITKYVAEALSKGEEDQVPSLFWTTGSVLGVISLLSTLILVIITPLLVEHFLNIPPELIEEAKVMFYWASAAIPVVMIANSSSGVLQAAQRFDLVNAVRLPLNVSIFLMPLVGLLSGLDLPGIMALILVSGIVGLAAFFVLTLRVLPNIRKISVEFATFARLFKYGGWIMISSLVHPAFVYFDRFLIGSLISTAAVAYYTAPFEVINRLTTIPLSLTMTLFPAFSALEATGERQRLGMFFTRSIKYTLLILGPIVLLLVLFASGILQLWLGGDFAIRSSMTLQILALGLLLNSLALVPHTLLQGVGRPDITAKFHLLELPFYLGIAWLLISRWGITGAATAWTIRVTLDALLLFIAAFRINRVPMRLVAINGLTLIFVLSLLAGMSYGVKRLTGPLPILVQAVLFLILFASFTWMVWRIILDVSDRREVLKVVRLWQGNWKKL